MKLRMTYSAAGLIALALIATPTAHADLVNANGARIDGLSHAADSAALGLQNDAGAKASIVSTGETAANSVADSGASLFLSLFAPVQAAQDDTAAVGWEVYE